MIATPRQLRELGIVGMNERNADFIQKYNRRAFYPLVDDKLKTKELAIKHGIAVPELYTVIEIEREIRNLAERLEPYGSFVIKPAQGSGGNGVWVVTDKVRDSWRKASGVLVGQGAMEHYVSNILNGMYSLGGLPDKAMVEYMVQFDPFFESVSYQGVPDIRVIVFRGIPIAAMVRLPTRRSDGKANLHQGAIGVGLDLASGVTLDGTWHNLKIERHPDTANPVAGLTVPDWQECLELAARCYDLTGLGYLGVDLVMDHEHGPMMLELNARPGLNIQIAMDDGLLRRCQIIEKQLEALKDETRPVAERVAFAKQQFAVAGPVPAEEE